MAQPSQAKMKLPNAEFEFGIKIGEMTVSGLNEALLCVFYYLLSVQCVLPVIGAMLFTHPPPPDFKILHSTLSMTSDKEHLSPTWITITLLLYFEVCLNFAC